MENRTVKTNQVIRRIWETEKNPGNSNKEHERRKNHESSTIQVELSYLKEEIKRLKRSLDIVLKRQ